MSDFNQAKYIQQFQKEKYDRCIFNVPKGQKTIIEAHWKRMGYKSLNSYINHLIQQDMEERGMQLSSEEEIILKRYRYGSDQDRKEIWSLVLKIDAKYTDEEKKQLFEEYKNKIKVKNNSGIIVGNNNGNINM